MRVVEIIAVAATAVAAAGVEDCPGYKASNVKQTTSGLTADLKLAGEPCNAYGEDLEDLVLSVEYQTGERKFDHPPIHRVHWVP